MYNYSREGIEQLGREGVQTLGETKSTKLVRVLNQFDMFVIKDDISLTPCLTNDGFWESWITSWLTQWLRPGMTFIDIGANCGYYSLIADKLVGEYGTVVAYEPNPVYAELLRQTRNQNDANFKVREVALSDSPGDGILTVPENYHGSASTESKFENFKKTTAYPVAMSTLDLEVQNLTFFRHDIIKIDAEGAEEKIWDGAQNLLRSSDHTTLMLEYTPGAYSVQFLNKLFDWGHVSAITYDGKEERVSKTWIESLTDWRMLIIRKR